MNDHIPVAVAHMPSAIVSIGALSIPCAVCGAARDTYCFPNTKAFCQSRWVKARGVMFAATYEASVDAPSSILAKRRLALLAECPRCGTSRGAYCHPVKHSFCRERWRQACADYKAAAREHQPASGSEPSATGRRKENDNDQ